MKATRKTGKRGRAGSALLLCALCLGVAAVASVPAGILAAAQAGQDAAEGLRARAEQLTRALAAFSTTQVALREEGYATIRDVTAARHSMPEAVSVTITGPHQNEIYNSERCSVRDYVLASDEAAWEQARTEGSFRPGSVTAADEVARRGVIADFQREVEARLGAALAVQAARYRDERSALRAITTDPRRGSAEQLRAARGALVTLGRGIDETLSRELSALGAVRSYPAFDPCTPAASYVFYAPIAFFDPSVDYFCNGMVRLTVDTSSLRATVARAARRVGLASGGFGLLALCLGGAGAVVIGLGLTAPQARPGRGRSPGRAARGAGRRTGR